MQELKITPQDKILILAPHPDDESIACAGVLLKYPEQTTVCVLTDGCLGNPEWSESKTITTRKKEFVRAMAYAQISNYKMLGIRDCSLNKNLNMLKQIDFSRYNIIFCPNPYENHCDHKVVYKAIKKFINSKTLVVFYEVWSPIANPTHFIDISSIIKQKQKLISAYKSQTKQVNYSSRILGLNHYRGMLPNIKYAEAFKLVNL